MIRESVVDSILNRLSTSFGKRLVIRPPASAEEIANLERLVGPLPRDFSIFLLTCNGLRIDIDAPRGGQEWHLWHTQEMTAAILHPTGPCTPSQLLPFRGDPTSARDCLVAGHGPAEGAVVRWDPWARAVELVASSFGHYLDSWATYLTERFAQDAAQESQTDWPPLDADYLAKNDSSLADLQKQERVAEWLDELDYVLANGDDFE